MAFRDYLQVLTRRWRVILTFLAIGLIGAVLINMESTRTYKSSAQVLVSADATGDQTQQYQGTAATQARVKSYLTLATAPQVLQGVLADLHPGLTSDQLKSEISSDTPADQTVVNLHVTDTSATRAAALANSLARVFSQTVEQFETPNGTNQSSVKLVVTNPAVAASSPATPNITLNILIGLFAGLIVGLSVAALREMLDNTVKTPEDLTDVVDVPLLTTIVLDSDAPKRPIATKANARGQRAEGFRRLRTNLQFIDVDHQPRILAITSSVPGEGKSSTAINIAAALAEAGHSVCLVDADLRRPSIGSTLGLVGKVGLTNVLINQIELSEAYQEAGPLKVLASGPLPPNPSELLGSEQMRTLLHKIKAEMDFVIVDTAPLLPVSDGAEVAAAADGSIMVARWGSTTYAQIRRGADALEQVDARLLGMVLNRVPGREAAYYGYRYYQKQDAEVSHRRKPA